MGLCHTVSGLRSGWQENQLLLWQSLKYEDLYLKGYADGLEAKIGIVRWVAFYKRSKEASTRMLRASARSGGSAGLE
jgi:hypothetical protein